MNLIIVDSVRVLGEHSFEYDVLTVLDNLKILAECLGVYFLQKVFDSVALEQFELVGILERVLLLVYLEHLVDHQHLLLFLSRAPPTLAVGALLPAVGLSSEEHLGFRSFLDLFWDDDCLLLRC